MHQNTGRKIFIYIFFFLFLGTINNLELNKLFYTKIINISVSGLGKENDLDLKRKINFIKSGNVFFLDKKKIQEIINSNSLVEDYLIIKEYPSTLRIKIKKTKFLAKTNISGDIYLLGSNGKLTKEKSKIKNLPFVFGNPDIEEFLNFKEIIDLSKFEYDDLENLYFFPSIRWDIKTKKVLIIRLPNKNLDKVLELCFDILSNRKFNNYNKTIDARIKDQIILND